MYPKSIEDLAIYLSVGVLGLLVWVIKRVFTDQKSLSAILANHFKEDQKALTEISAHMAVTNEIHRDVRDRLLDAALRKPEDGQ